MGQCSDANRSVTVLIIWSIFRFQSCTDCSLNHQLFCLHSRPAPGQDRGAAADDSGTVNISLCLIICNLNCIWIILEKAVTAVAKAIFRPKQALQQPQSSVAEVVWRCFICDEHNCHKIFSLSKQTDTDQNKLLVSLCYSIDCVYEMNKTRTQQVE